MTFGRRRFLRCANWRSAYELVRCWRHTRKCVYGHAGGRGKENGRVRRDMPITRRVSCSYSLCHHVIRQLMGSRQCCDESHDSVTCTCVVCRETYMVLLGRLERMRARVPCILHAGYVNPSLARHHPRCFSLLHHLSIIRSFRSGSHMCSRHMVLLYSSSEGRCAVCPSS